MSRTSLQTLVCLLLSGLAVSAWGQQATLQTLFTTEQERRVINANRYKEDKKPETTKPTEVKEQQPVRQFIQEEVEAQYRISGVSTDREGSKTAWVNGQTYAPGDTLDDGSKVSISGTTVVITTIDGKRHRGKSGEVLDVTYLRPVEE